MKEYSHKTRKWEEKTEKVGSLKRPETCKGKKPHDFVLLLPPNVHANHLLCKDEINAYYIIAIDKEKSDKEYAEKLSNLGITTRSWSYGVHWFFKCAKCGKEKYE